MQDSVIEAIAKLIAQKKQPSVALVKANLTQAVPMPIIIDVLSRYKQNPEAFDLSPPPTSAPEVTTHETTQLDRIEAKLDKLLALLEQKQ